MGTGGRIVLILQANQFQGVTDFPECDTLLVGRKTSQHLGHTEGICSHGLLGFISQPLFSDAWGVCLSLPSRKMQFVFQDPLTVALDTTNPLLFLCLFSSYAPSPKKTRGTTPTCYTPVVHVHFGQPQNSKLWATTLIQNTATNSCLSLLICCYYSVTKPCLTPCHPKDCSMPGSPVLPYLLKFASIESVTLSNHLILCHPLLLWLLTFPSISDFSNELAFHNMWPKYWSFHFSIIYPS